VIILIDKIERLLENNGQSGTTELGRVSLDHIQLHYDFAIEYPRQVESVCLTILMLGEIFLEMKDEEGNYFSALIDIYRKVNRVVFREEVI
jgi:hypothetical protein